MSNVQPLVSSPNTHCLIGTGHWQDMAGHLILLLGPLAHLATADDAADAIGTDAEGADATAVILLFVSLFVLLIRL